jgi:DNA-binding CsgD family transcriptional regulator
VKFLGVAHASSTARGVSYSRDPREVEILNLLSQGLANAEIGMTMGIAERTVKGHIMRLEAKLQVNSEKTGNRILLARYWQCELFRIGAGRDDHP